MPLRFASEYPTYSAPEKPANQDYEEFRRTIRTKWPCEIYEIIEGIMQIPKNSNVSNTIPSY